MKEGDWIEREDGGAIWVGDGFPCYRAKVTEVLEGVVKVEGLENAVVPMGDMKVVDE